MPNVFRKFRFVWIFFMCKRFNMIPVSFFKCVWSHANVGLCVLCVACVHCCFVSNVLIHALVLQWACVLVPTVTVVCTNVLWFAFPNKRVLWLVIIDLTLLMQDLSRASTCPYFKLVWPDSSEQLCHHVLFHPIRVLSEIRSTLNSK